MNRGFLRCTVALALTALCLCLGIGAGSASAAGASYEFDQTLSLRGDCGKGAPDNIPDPGCPGGTHPALGRFAEPRSIAVDAYGDEYVMSAAFNGEPRIDVFDDEGNFLTEMADPHHPKSVAVDSKGNLYAFEQSGGAEAEDGPLLADALRTCARKNRIRGLAGGDRDRGSISWGLGGRCLRRPSIRRTRRQLPRGIPAFSQKQAMPSFMKSHFRTSRGRRRRPAGATGWLGGRAAPAPVCELLQG